MRVTPPFGFTQGREPVERQMGVFRQPPRGYLRALLQAVIDLERYLGDIKRRIYS